MKGLARSSRQLKQGIVGTPTIVGTAKRGDILIGGATFGAEFKY